MTDYTVKTSQQLGAVLRGYRKELSLTQQEIGMKSGVSQPIISQMEVDPGPKALSQLLKVLAGLDLELVVRKKRPSQAPADW